MEQNKNKKIWFKAKRYGWGWTPSSWQGWLVLLLYVVIMIFIFMRVDGTSHSNSDTLIGVSLPFVALSSLLIFICYKKGDRPGWRFGSKK